MPPFTRKAAAPEPAPQPTEPSATERLGVLLREQSEIHATLAEHRERRARLLRKDGTLTAISVLATEGDQLRLRLEQIGLRLAGVEQELEQERREAFEASWQTHRPGLAQAEVELAAAIRAFYATLRRAQELHTAARGFGDRVTAEFVRPPPAEPINNYSLQVYLQTIEQRQRQTAQAAAPAVLFEVAEDVAAQERFVPWRVSPDEIERISAIAPPRKVRILHGPIRSANLNIGYARLHPGETPIVSARAAHALVASGCAEYADEAATAAA